MSQLLALPLMLLMLVQQPSASSIQPLPAHVRANLVDGGYWKPGCPVLLRDLRLLTVTHWGFDGRAHRGQLIVNEDFAAPLAGVFRRLYALRFPIRYLRVDIYEPGKALPAHNDVSGSFECREAVPSPCVGGGRSGSWSNHAYGLAIDLNPRENPYVGCGKVRDGRRSPYIVRAPLRKGMVTPAVVRAFRSIGWGWGGIWTGDTKDYMHFSVNGR
jgi:D-alanyl-D-alanine carboxypeptidase-like protein